MKWRAILLLMVFMLLGCRQVTSDGWIPLFNGQNLEGWYTWLPSTGKNNDPKGIFKVKDGMIHILDIPVTEQDQEFGYLATDLDYQRYVLQLEYKWGSKKFPPRANLKRDSGLLYYFVGPDKIWPRAVECQIQEGDTGDLITLGGTVLDTTLESLDTKRYKADGIAYTTDSSGTDYIIKSETFESSNDQWTQVEITVDGDTITHKINGQINFQGRNVRQLDPNSPSGLQPLRKGRILLQAEGAEIFYRNIRIKLLN